MIAQRMCMREQTHTFDGRTPTVFLNSGLIIRSIAFFGSAVTRSGTVLPLFPVMLMTCSRSHSFFSEGCSVAANSSFANPMTSGIRAYCSSSTCAASPARLLLKVINLATLCLKKNDNDVLRYNFNAHQPSLSLIHI